MIALLFIFSAIFCANAQPTTWLFDFNESQVCQIQLQYKTIQINLTDVYSQNSEKMLQLSTDPHFCAPQACFEREGRFEFLCLNYTTWKFTTIKANEREGKELRIDARLIRFDSQKSQLAVWNGKNVRLFSLPHTNGSMGDLKQRLKVDLPPSTHVDDLHVYANKIWLLIKGGIYRLDEKNGRLYLEMWSGFHKFPFQYKSSALLVRATRGGMQDHTSFGQMFSQLAFPLISLAEFLILIVLAYSCKWKIFRTRDGRFTVKTHDETSEEGDEQVYSSTIEK